MLSDAVDLDVPKLSDLVISLYVPGEAAAPTMHLTGLHTTYISKPGDFAGAPSIADPTTRNPGIGFRRWMSSRPPIRRLVAFGDSITDGATSTPDTDRAGPANWPSVCSGQLPRRIWRSSIKAFRETACCAMAPGFPRWPASTATCSASPA